LWIANWKKKILHRIPEVSKLKYIFYVKLIFEVGINRQILEDLSRLETLKHEVHVFTYTKFDFSLKTEVLESNYK
jgi:hypothetical protein